MKFNNKKGFIPGWQYIAGFFLVAIVFAFVVGMYDFTLVEVYDPFHTILNDSLTAQGKNTGEAYEAFNENYTTTKTKTLPFNMLYIFLFAEAVVMSLINVSRSQKYDPFELVYKTIGGLIFFLYIMQTIVFSFVTYFKVEVVDYLFKDLVVTYIPFYLVTYNNAGIIILIWAVVLLIFNQLMGKEKQQEFKGVFGQ